MAEVVAMLAAVAEVVAVATEGPDAMVQVLELRWPAYWAAT